MHFFPSGSRLIGDKVARPMCSVLGVLVLFVAFGAPVGSQERGPLEIDIIELADGVFVANRPPYWRYPVIANVTFVVNEDDVVVVDGGGLPQHSENVIAEIKKITDKPVSVVLTTHWHGDHNVGLGAYRKHYPNVRIVAQENTRSAMVGGAMDYLQLPENFDLEERIESHKQRLQKAIDDNESPIAIEFRRLIVEDYRLIFEQYEQGEWLAADETFKDRYVLQRGNRTIEFLYFGRGNTDGDAIMWLPQEKIVVTGDLVVRATPFGFGSYPQEWAGALRAVQALEYDALVPGHGNVQHDNEYVATLIDLMDFVAAKASAAAATGIEDVEEFRETVDFSEFDHRLANDDPEMIHFFDIWFKTPILEYALKLANGDDFTQTDF